jgi:putative ABC transport system permease protein
VWILRRLSIYEQLFAATRDYEVEYQERCERRGRLSGSLWLLGSVSHTAFSYVVLAFKWKTVMFRNYTKIALRNILRFRLFSLIKIFSLSLGIAVCILLCLFVLDELSFDKFHDKGDYLFRVVRISYDKDTGTEIDRQQFMPPPMAPELQRHVPEIKHYSRYTNGSGVVRFKDKIFRETLHFVDAAFLEMFSFPLVEGLPAQTLAEDHGVVFSRLCAEKYFGASDPMGQSVSIDFGVSRKEFIVTGVVADVPPNSTLQFDILINIRNLPGAWNNPGVWEEWNRWAFPFFVELQPGVSTAQVESGMDGFLNQFFGDNIQRHLDEGHDPYRFGLQRVRDMHLDTRVIGTAGLQSSYLLAVIAIAILVIACVNFTNLSIGLSSVRSLEVGVRKVLGAERKQLVTQFLGEACMMSLLAIGFGLILAELLLHRFNVLADKQLSLGLLLNSRFVVILLFIAVFTTLTAGIYPAVILSAFRPVEVMKGRLKIGGRTLLTKTLVVFQFALSVTLAISALFLSKQLTFMQNQDPGYSSDALVVVLTQENDQRDSEDFLRRFRSEVRSISSIRGLTASNREFGFFLPSAGMEFKGRDINFHYTRVDPDFLATMKLRLVEGRDFKRNILADNEVVIVNQEFVKALGPDFQLGETLGDPSLGFPQHCRVVGVIEDCHFQSLRSEIRPLLLYVGKGWSPRRDRFSRVLVRIDPGNVSGTMEMMETAWERTQPHKPFVFFFQDEALKNLYSQEKRWSSIVRSASVFCMMLACLGIFGLTAMTISRRDKEIGIRKVLGARFEQIVYLAVREYMLLLVVANITAWPVAYVVMANILQNYPYRITLGFPYFFLAGAASILIGLLTILWLSVRAALTNPVNSLKYE